MQSPLTLLLLPLCYLLFSFPTKVLSDDCTYYGDYDALPVSTVTCSDHPPGLYSNPSWGYTYQTKISQVSQLHNNGRLYATAWNAVAGTGDANHCLYCLQVSTGTKSVRVTVIDKKGASGVDLSDAAFDCLFGAGAHVGGGTFQVKVASLGPGPCPGGGGCLSGVPAVPNTTQISCQSRYTVVSGDTGVGIASKLGITWAQLQALNPTTVWTALQIGQQLCAPTRTPATPVPTSPPISPVSGTCTFSLNTKNNFIGYWGQNSGGYEKTLGSYCTAGDNTFTAFHIAFLNYFGDPNVHDSIRMNLADKCWSSCNNPSQPGLLCCPSVAADIQLCQSRGKKVLMSLGGAADYGLYSLTSASGTALADWLWNYFLGGNSVSASNRPFGSVVLDGIDLDIENAKGGGYQALITRLRVLFATSSRRYYISGAPQCVFPDASLGPGIGMALSVGGGVSLDYIVVQFYNNGICNIGQSNFVNAFNQYANTSVSKVMVGFLGLRDSGSGFVDSGSLATALQTVWSHPKFGGIMAWDTGTVTHNMEGGSVSYANRISSALRSYFPCSGSSIPAPPPPPPPPAGPPAVVVVPTSPPKVPTSAPKSGVTAWSSGGVAYARGQCVQYNGKLYTCLQPHTSLTGWDPVSAPALWQSVNSCPAAAEVQSSMPGQWKWLIPLIGVIAVLMISIGVVLFKKRQRDRAYSGELGIPVPSPTTPEKTEEKPEEKPEEKMEENILKATGEAANQPPPLEKALDAPPTYTQVPTSPTKADATFESSELESTPLSPTTPGPIEPSAQFRHRQIQVPTSPTPLSPVSLSAEWERRIEASSGRFFYHNVITGVSQWEVPDGF